MQRGEPNHHDIPVYLDNSDSTRLMAFDSAMLNVSLETPFQFHSTPFEVLDDDSGLNGSVASYEYGEDHFSTGRRGRYNDRTSRRARSPHRRIRPQNGVNGTTNGYENGHGHASASSDTYRHGHRASRSSSREGSYASDYSSYSYEEDMYDYEGEDEYDPEEEAHLRRLRGPKLNVKMIPHPARQQEIEEEEERLAKEEANFRLGDGEVTPVQERRSMSVGPPLLEIPDKIVVKPLSPDDKDAVSFRSLPAYIFLNN